jgi:hypothetical protein
VSSNLFIAIGNRIQCCNVGMMPQVMQCGRDTIQQATHWGTQKIARNIQNMQKLEIKNYPPLWGGNRKTHHTTREPPDQENLTTRLSYLPSMLQRSRHHPLLLTAPSPHTFPSSQQNLSTHQPGSTPEKEFTTIDENWITPRENY